MKKLPSLTIFFPSLNDAKILPYLIIKSAVIAKKISLDYEIIVINDGSTDDTDEILNQLAKTIKNLRVIKHKRNLGYGKALQSGFKAARKNWIFYTDGDGQYDVSDLVSLAIYADKKTDVVNGCKLNRHDGLFRNIIGSFYNYLLHLLYSLPISDLDCDFRLIRRKCLSAIDLEGTSGVVCLELIDKLAKGGAKFKEVGIRHYPRYFGKSEFFRLGNLKNTLLDNLSYFKNRQRLP